MYEKFYGLSSKPFQLKPDARFFYGSKGHKRAMSYLEYGISQGEGFIVITGEIGAGKTTLIRNLFLELVTDNIVAAQIVNTHVGSEDILRLVAAAFGLEYENLSKASLLRKIEEFLINVDRQGKRALLVVDEAQNLTPRALEELRMLSNFQTADKCLLQTFLLGQPEFRQVIHTPEMQQLYQRIIASYHLGPLDVIETRSYIEHRLTTVGWKNSPEINREAFIAIHDYTGGIPRKINSFCDRMLLMGFLDEILVFTDAEIKKVINDIQQESAVPAQTPVVSLPDQIDELVDNYSDAAMVDERLTRVEKALISVIGAVKKIVPTLKTSNLPD